MSKPKSNLAEAAPAPVVAQPAKRPRGRPARLSEAAIIAKTMDLVAVRALDDITMALVAESLGVPTMSLYNYFPNTSALFAAVAEHAFSLFEFPERELKKPWQQAVLAWLWAMQKHFDTHPLAMKMLLVEGQSTLPWVRAMSPLLKIFKRTGLKGERLTFAFCWFTSQASGVMAVERFAHETRATDNSVAILEAMSREDQDNAAELGKYVLKIKRKDVLEFSFNAIIDALEKLVAEAKKAERK